VIAVASPHGTEASISTVERSSSRLMSVPVRDDWGVQQDRVSVDRLLVRECSQIHTERCATASSEHQSLILL
jgi:hypothetical protein